MPRPTSLLLLSLRLAARLPLRVLRAAGAILGRAAWLASSPYRRKAMTNLDLAGYVGTPVARQAAAEAGRMVGELPWIWFRPVREMLVKVRCDDVSPIEQAEQAGRGILFLTPHLGAFEITARWYAHRAPITVLFKPPRKSALAPVLEAARALPGLQAAPANLGGLRVLLRALRRGEAVGLLPDQVPSDGEGVWAPFFGKPAWTMTLPQRLADTTGASIVLAVAQRLPSGLGWQLHLEAFDREPTPAAVNAAMEALVRRHPAQYLWGYNRFKRPAHG